MMRLAFATLALVACSKGGPSSNGGPDAPTAPDGAQPGSDAPPPVDAQTYRFLCDQPPGEGAPTPEPPALPAAGCPMLVPGQNTFTSSGKQRQFILVVPANLMADEKLPVLFLWHWLGGSAQGFVDRGEVQAAVDQQRFIAIAPISEGAKLLGTSWDLKWPFDITQSQARMNEEFQFFDDMLACAEAQFNVNQSCVSTVGVSAGALFNDQLAQARSNRLASFMSLSGGVGDTIIKPWTAANVTHKLPSIVLWGGDGPPNMDGNKDILGCFGIGMDFMVASNTLEDALVAGGQFFVECKHNCGHVEPPLDAHAGESKYAPIWRFAFDHPFWLGPGQSPWSSGLPADMPAWCGIGKGGATPRSGAGCPPAENPCQF